MSIRNNKIASAIMEFSNGKNVPMHPYMNLPISNEDVLDETHGTAKIIMTDMRQKDFDKYNVRIDKPFRVNTAIEITFEGQKTVIRKIVARDSAEMVRKDGYETWSHTVELVDEAKALEQEPVDNLTFKNPVPRDYEAGGTAPWNYRYEGTNGVPSTDENNNYKPNFSVNQFYKIGDEITFSDSLSSFWYHNTPTLKKIINYCKITLFYPNGSSKDFDSTLTINNDEYAESVYSMRLTDSGEYSLRIILEYKWRYEETLSATVVTLEYKTYFTVLDGQDSFRPYTLKDTIDRVLSVTPTRCKRIRSGYSTYDTLRNKYIFRNNAEELSTEESPEFSFTGKHLFEVMLDIASYKKSFPGLYKNEIYFRPLWNGITIMDDDLPPPNHALINSAIDQYCTALDSYVENMVCVNDSGIGTVVEPYRDGYMTTRSSAGSEISDSTAIIPTQDPIYDSVSLHMDTFAYKMPTIGDINAYVYEQEDYDSLSDMYVAYPYSKAYALKYTRFQKDYGELAHRVQASNSVADALKQPALANIAQVKAGASAGASAGVGLKDYINGLLGVGNGSSFANLFFRTTYIPVVNARVRQYKPFFDAEDYDATLYYNQQAELVDSEAFGEHVKGMVQKLGNHTEIRTYQFEKIDDVPTVGTRIGEKSVYDVAVTIYETHVNATICLVDYAELSNHIGVKNEIKTSDISTTKWSNRYINWEEFFVFTRNDIAGDSYSITKDALQGITTFNQSDALTCAAIDTYAEKGAVIAHVLAPVKHLAIGNSIYFQFNMLDNFAAGYQLEEAPDGATSVVTGTRYNRAQKAVRYCDRLGRLETLDFQLCRSGPIFDAQIEPMAYAYPENACHTIFPNPSSSDANIRPVFSVDELLVKKNSAEALKFSAQYHFRHDWRDFVIGSGMTNFCSFIGGQAAATLLVVLDRPLNRFERHISLKDIEKNKSWQVVGFSPLFDVEEDNKRVKLTLPDTINTSDIDVKSWAFVGEDRNGNYQLIFGENKGANAIQFDKTIYLVAKRKNIDPPKRVQYKLEWVRHTQTYIPGTIFISGPGIVKIPSQISDTEFDYLIDGGLEVEAKNMSNVNLYFRLDGGADHKIAPGEVFKFTMYHDMTYNVRIPIEEGGGGNVVEPV